MNNAMATKSQSKPNSPQEQFWAGSFGDEYIQRNQGEQLLASNLHFFSQALRNAGKINSCVEFGANIGMNLRALQLLYPTCQLRGVEINQKAADELASWLGEKNVSRGSILDYSESNTSDVTLIKGVLIHINPEQLQQIYAKLYENSHQWILVCEYYNPTPVSIPYRGVQDRLFKRDFAGDILDRYPDVELVDYGFSYRRDRAFPQDDITWFLLRKGNGSCSTAE